MEHDPEINPETPPDKAGSRYLWRKVRLFMYLASQSPLPLRQRAKGALTAGHLGAFSAPLAAWGTLIEINERPPGQSPWLYVFIALFYGGAGIFSLLLIRWGYRTLNWLDSK